MKLVSSSLPIKKALELLRKISADDNNVIFGIHAWERIDGREITAKQAINVIRTGQLEGLPQKGRKAGEWVVNIWGHGFRNRDIRVVTVIIFEKKLFVKTVMWKDL
jgi:hypothetical protein